MPVITTGELMRLYWLAEATYGVTPSGSPLTWGSELESVKDDTVTDREFHNYSGSRSFTATTRGPWKCGYTAKCRARKASGGYDWTKFFALNGFGALAALTDRLPSFSTQIGIKQVTTGTAYQYFLYNGCKMNKLVIGSTGPGKEITFDASVMSRFVSYSTSKTFAGLQNVTVGADASDMYTDTLSWTGVLYRIIAGGGNVAFYPRDWKLTIDNHLEMEPGNLLGADSSYYQIANTIEEGNRDITFEATIPAIDQTYQTAKRNGSFIDAVQIPIDAKVITLSNGYMTEDDFPEYKQAVNQETIKVSFKTLTVA
jgi:hypothetical protein